MRTSFILARLDLTKGIADFITIKRDSPSYHQPLDYEGVHFKCGKCRDYAHFGSNCAIVGEGKR